MSPLVTALQTSVRDSLSRAADPSRSEPMRAYMKSALPYYGVSAVPLRKLCKQLFTDHPLPDEASWRSAVLTLFREATHREERYVAVELSGARQYKKFQNTSIVPMYEELIVQGAWWDIVDTVAIHRIGPILLANPAAMKPLMLAWSRDEDHWRRRTSIICQVAAKRSTDLDLLYRAIEPNLPEKDFFLRKGIGWALRAYAWIDPEEIRRYVTANQARLSPLSRKEAMKNIA